MSYELKVQLFNQLQKLGLAENSLLLIVIPLAQAAQNCLLAVVAHLRNWVGLITISLAE